MPNKHAMLSASSSARWLACPPSAQLCAVLAGYRDRLRPGRHVCPRVGRVQSAKSCLAIRHPNPTENLDFYDAEMEDCTDSYAQYIAELLATLQEPMVLVEQRLDFSRYVPGRLRHGRLRDCCRFRSNRYRLQVWQGRGGVCRPQLADDAVRSGGVGTVRCPL